MLIENDTEPLTVDNVTENALAQVALYQKVREMLNEGEQERTIADQRIPNDLSVSKFLATKHPGLFLKHCFVPHKTQKLALKNATLRRRIDDNWKTIGLT